MDFFRKIKYFPNSRKPLSATSQSLLNLIRVEKVSWKFVRLLCRIEYVSRGIGSSVLAIFNYFKIGWVLLTQFWSIWGFQHLVRWNWQNLMFAKNKVLYKNCRVKPRPETTSWFWILDPFLSFYLDAVVKSFIWMNF